MGEHYSNGLATLADDMSVTEQVTFHSFIGNIACYLYHFDTLAPATLLASIVY